MYNQYSSEQPVNSSVGMPQQQPPSLTDPNQGNEYLQQDQSMGYFQGDQGQTSQYAPQQGYYPPQMPMMNMPSDQGYSGSSDSNSMPNGAGYNMPSQMSMPMSYQQQQQYQQQLQQQYQQQFQQQQQYQQQQYQQQGYFPPQMEYNPYAMAMGGMGMGGMMGYGAQFMGPYGQQYNSMMLPRNVDNRNSDGISGRWRDEEHDIFLKGLNKYGRKWKKISLMVKTRTAVQIRTHAQKYFQSLLRNKDARNGRGPAAPSVSDAAGLSAAHGEEDTLSGEDDDCTHATDTDDNSSLIHAAKKQRVSDASNLSYIQDGVVVTKTDVSPSADRENVTPPADVSYAPIEATSELAPIDVAVPGYGFDDVPVLGAECGLQIDRPHALIPTAGGLDAPHPKSDDGEGVALPPVVAARSAPEAIEATSTSPMATDGVSEVAEPTNSSLSIEGRYEELRP